MTLPTKPEAVAHVSDQHWEAALIEVVRRSDSGIFDPKQRLASIRESSQAGAADYARCLILLGEVAAPVDPIETAIEALAGYWGYSGRQKIAVCADVRKHFAGLTFPAVQP